MRIARVNITIPDELLGRARDLGLNISSVASAALAEELHRRGRVEALDGYLRDLDAELGPISREDAEAARAWADRALGIVEDKRSA